MTERSDHGVHQAQSQFQVVPVPDGVLVTMSTDALTVFRQTLLQLAALLERREVIETRRRAFGLARPVSADDVLARMFPDAYADAASAMGFRQRHEATMHADVLAATGRVLDWDGTTPAHLSGEDVDDWLMVIGAAQFLFVPRTRGLRASVPTVPLQRWLSHVQHQLVMAVCPQLVAEVGHAFQTGP